MEQLVILMQSELLLARAAAAPAEQRATDAEARVLSARSDGVVCTRVLGQQESFHIASDSW